MLSTYSTVTLFMGEAVANINTGRLLGTVRYSEGKLLCTLCIT